MVLLLEGQTAVVTGGGSGIGRATALLLAEAGANVMVGDFNLEAARQTVELGQGQNLAGQLGAFEVNVAVPALGQALIDATVAAWGGLDILVNNAGVGVPGTVLTTSEADYDRIMNVNVKGTFFTSAAAIRQMQRQGVERGGAIVSLSSIVATVAVPDRAAYGASKGAILSLTKALAADHVKDGIRVNCVCPGTIDTPWVERMVASYPDPAEAHRRMVARQPVGRLGTAAEIAQAILYLVGPGGSFITGTALVVDGGFTGFKLPN